MEYFLGSLVTLIILVVLEKAIRNNPINHKPLKHSQSYIHQVFYGHLLASQHLPPLETQATKHLLSSHKETRVVIHDNEAFWILSNTLFTARLNHGEIDRDSTKIVDTMALDKVELNKLMIIVEKLTEGLTENDNRNPGDQELF
jgi:hypothetical protein